jgi:hypothetical protein
MGVIKGSEQTLFAPVEDETPRAALTLPAYLALSARAQATFAGRRREIYALFEAYMRARRERGDYDAPDRTHAILRELRARGVKGRKLDFL